MKKLFHQYSLKRLLRKTPVPMNTQFKQQLYARVLQQAENIPEQSLTFNSFMKIYKLSIGIVPIVVAVALISVTQFVSRTTTNQPFLFTKEALAASIENTFQLNPTNIFTYKKIISEHTQKDSVDTTSAKMELEVWNDGQNTRMDTQIDNTKVSQLISGIDNITCYYSSDSHQVLPPKKCTDGFDIGMAPMKNAQDLIVSNVYAEKAPSEEDHGDMYITWTTNHEVQNGRIAFSVGKTGYQNIVNTIYSWQEGENYVNRVTLFSKDFDIKDFGSGIVEDFMLVQFSEEVNHTTQQSPVYQLQFSTLQVTPVSDDDLEKARKQFQEKIRTSMTSADSVDHLYETLFLIPLDIKKRLDELGEPVLVEERQKDDKQTTRVQYHLPDIYMDQFQKGSIVEFTFTHAPEKLIDYKIIAPDGTVTEHIQLAEEKEIKNIPADQFFTRTYWETDLQ